MSVVKESFRYMTLLDVNEVLPDPTKEEIPTPTEEVTIIPTKPVEAEAKGIPILPIMLIGGALLYIMMRRRE